MNLKNLAKIVLLTGFASIYSSAMDKAAPRPTGTYPTAKRLAVVTVGVVGLNYALGFGEQKLGLNEKNTKFPFTN